MRRIQQDLELEAAAHALRAALAPPALLRHDLHVEAHQRLDVANLSAFARRDHHVSVLAAHARQHLHHARVAGASVGIDPLEQLHLARHRYVGRGHAHRIQLDRAPAGAHPGGAPRTGAFGDGARGTGGDLEALERHVVGVRVALALARDRAHAQSLLDVTAAGLDDAFLERDRVAERVLEVQVRVVHRPRERQIERRREPSVVETEAVAEEPERYVGHRRSCRRRAAGVGQVSTATTALAPATDPDYPRAVTTSRREQLEQALSERILVLDGAMGSLIQAYGLSEAEVRGERFAGHRCDLRNDGELLVLTRPQVIREIHERYLAAGADIIETDTFGATSIAQADFELSGLAHELNVSAARIARAACDAATALDPSRPRFVAGSIGPLPKTLSVATHVDDPGARDVTFDEVYAAYAEQVRGLVDGGADLLLVETIFDTLNCKAAICAIRDVLAEKRVDLPLALSVTFSDQSGRNLSGQTIEAFWTSVEHARPLAVGLNCGMGAAEVRPYVQRLAEIADTRILCYPNAGLPNALGQYEQTPEQMSALLSRVRARGPAQPGRRLLRHHARPHPRRSPRRCAGSRRAASPAPVRRTRFAGLEPFEIRPESNFVMIGERTNVTGSKRFARLIESGAYEKAAEVALDQVRGGANVIDVNMDDAMLDSEQAMTRFLNLISADPEIARLPVMVDSLQVVGDRGGPEVPAGQADRQLDQPQGRRGGLPRQGAARAPLRRRAGRDGVRRARPGRHRRAQGRDLPARLPAADREARRSAGRHHLRSQRPGGRHRHRGARRLRAQLHRGRAHPQAAPARARGSAAASAT